MSTDTPLNSVDVSSESVEPPSWSDGARRFVRRVLSELGIRGWDVSIVFCDDAFIRNLNSTYRHVDAPTDVLSFSQVGPAGSDAHRDHANAAGETSDLQPAGDVVISLDTMHRQAAEYGVTVEEELKRLLIHGLLHLAGYDHGEQRDDGEMMDVQEDLLSRLTEERVF
jgi:probable rRNA maturation factor